MNREAEIEQMIKQTIIEFVADLKGYKIVLFGSRASGSANQRSDFDIGVIGDKTLPLETFSAIQDALEQLPTLYKIDWVDLMKVDRDFLKLAFENTKVIYE